MNNQDNVTFRRALTSLIPDRNESDMSIDPIDVSTSSLPEIIPDNTQVELVNKIESLQTQLNSAHQEIEQLLLENKDLRNNNQQLAKKNTLYRKIGFSPSRSATTTSTPGKKSHLKTTVHTKTQTVTKEMIHKETQTHSTPPSTKTNPDMNKPDMNTSSSRPEKENHTQNKTYSIPNLANTIQKPTLTLEPSTEKPKICLISSNKENKVLSVAQDVMHRDDYKLCHYLTPQAYTPQLLTGLQAKLTGFTSNDYCIIFISDEDFLDNINYLDLIKCIRENLKKITHTNIILCAPHYHYGYGTYTVNHRVYKFNELLLQDILTHKYAELLDTNKYLVYDFSMFHKPSGKINNTGLRTIFQYLECLVKNCKKHLRDTIESADISKTFFRDQ